MAENKKLSAEELAKQNAELAAKVESLQKDLAAANGKETKKIPGVFVSENAKTKGKKYGFRDNIVAFHSKGKKHDSARLMKAAADASDELHVLAKSELEGLVKMGSTLLVELD